MRPSSGVHFTHGKSRSAVFLHLLRSKHPSFKSEYWEAVMDLIHERAAGIDISKTDAKLAIRAPRKRAGTFSTTVTTWGATTNEILALRQMLVPERVTTILIEATSDY